MTIKINTKRGIAPIAAIIIALIIIAGGAYAIKKGMGKKPETSNMATSTKTVEMENQKPMATTTPSTIHIKLDEQNNSGQKGEATITQTGTSTIKVIVNITGKPSGVPQPAHIHLGSCPNPGAIKYPLTNVSKGASQTEIPITMEELLSELPLAINVHKSQPEIKTYTSCGNIELKSMENGMSGEGAAAITALPQETKVNYTSAGFAPKTVTVKKGDIVVFENKTGRPMSVASNPHPTHTLYPEFDQYKTDQRGKDEFRFTFEKVGTWGYHDHLNASMTGTVVVTE